jgi:hypothetical protein
VLIVVPRSSADVMVGAPIEVRGTQSGVSAPVARAGTFHLAIQAHDVTWTVSVEPVN